MQANEIMRSILAAVAIVLGVAHSALAAIEVEGSIVDQVWDGPVRVRGPLSVVSLTILPGVVVEFTGSYQVTVTGVIRAVGTSEAPVVLRPARDNSEGWQGFLFENALPGSEFEWCHFMGAREGAVRLVHSNPTFRNCTFLENSSTGSGGAIYAYLREGDLEISNCEFTGKAPIGGFFNGLRGSHQARGPEHHREKPGPVRGAVDGVRELPRRGFETQQKARDRG